MSADSKMAQVAKGTKTCKTCGKNHPIAEFPLHPRWKTLMHICNDCMAEKRKETGKKVSAKAKAKQRAKVKAAEKAAASLIIPGTPMPEPSIPLEVVDRMGSKITRLEGMSDMANDVMEGMENFHKELQVFFDEVRDLITKS